MAFFRRPTPTPVKGILKSRPSTPAVSDSGTSVGEKSKKLADKALNILNPARKYQKRRKELFKALAWWEDEEQNPEGISSRRKIITNLEQYKVAVRSMPALHEIIEDEKKLSL